MKTTSVVLLNILIAALLASCASLSEQECQTADWHTIGYEDGAKGYGTQQIARHRKACAKYGVSPNFDRYLAGHAKGVPLYCVADKGYYLGSRGSAYPTPCPAQTYPQFERAYRRGQAVYAVQSEINQMQSDWNALDEQLHQLQQQIADNEAAIIADGTPPETRRTLIEDNKALAEDAVHLEDELFHLGNKIDARKRKLESM